MRRRPEMNRLFPFWLAVAATLVISDHASAQTLLRVGDQKGNARAVLEAAHALEKLDYKIEWVEFPAAAPLLEAANAGVIDAGTVGDAPFTFAVAAGVPVRAVAAIRWNPESLAVLVRGDSPIKSFRDLAGKRIATGRGSIGHQLVLAEVEKEGLKAGDIQLAFLSPADAGIALQGGSVDAWSTWEPYMSQLELGSGARIVADGSNLTSGLTFFAARTDALSDPAKRAALKDLSARLAQARSWAAHNLHDYATTWSKIIGLPQAVGIKMFERQQTHPVLIDASVIEGEQKTIDLYFRAGLLKKHLEAKDVFDPVFNGAVAAALEP
jgi:sulfonate transport system substrate-binding protein